MKPQSLEKELLDVDMLVAHHIIGKAHGEEAKAKLRAKFAAEAEKETPNPNDAAPHVITREK